MRFSGVRIRTIQESRSRVAASRFRVRKFPGGGFRGDIMYSSRQSYSSLSWRLLNKCIICEELFSGDFGDSYCPYCWEDVKSGDHNEER